MSPPSAPASRRHRVWRAIFVASFTLYFGTAVLLLVLIFWAVAKHQSEWRALRHPLLCFLVLVGSGMSLFAASLGVRREDRRTSYLGIGSLLSSPLLLGVFLFLPKDGGMD